MEDFFPDLIALLCSHLTVQEIISLSCCSKTLRRKINSNNALWCNLCVKLLGTTAPETRKQLTVNVGLADKPLSWRDCFQVSFGSAVFSWGDATGGRLGHPNALKGKEDSMVEEPSEIVSLTGRGVDFVGKTAEMGSIALAFGGKSVYVWGNYARSANVVSLPAHLLCGNRTDHVVDASCHHDSGFILVFESGLTLVGKRMYHSRAAISPFDFCDYSRDIFGHELLQGEKAVVSLGSQSGYGGVRTNFGRILMWPCWDAEAHAQRPVYVSVATDASIDPVDELDSMFSRIDIEREDQIETLAKPLEPFKSVFVIEPYTDAGEKLDIAKSAFGHKYWYAIDTRGFLFEVRVGQDKAWHRVKGSEKIADPIVFVDCGSAHSVLVTSAKNAYTWGSNAFGMLGLGSDERSDMNEPTLVKSLEGRVVSAGAGGYRSWTGAFTLFLTDENEVYVSGKLGRHNMRCSTPAKVDSEGLRGRYILSISCGEDWAAIVASGKIDQQKQ